jgi:hypothetical protein
LAGVASGAVVSTAAAAATARVIFIMWESLPWALHER